MLFIWGQLTNFSDSLGETASYTYYSDGLRSSKTIGSNTTNYYYDGDNVINETLNGNSYATNVMGVNGYISRKQNGTVGYLFKDNHGDVLAAYSSISNRIADYTYDAWENIQNQGTQSWGEDNSLRPHGQYYDTESGMTYLRARYYDSSIRRFISEDSYWNVKNMIYDEDTNENQLNVYNNKSNVIPSLYYNNMIKTPQYKNILQSSNLYIYGINNPIHYIDIYGLAVTAYGFVATVGAGFVGYEGMYLWAVDDVGNFALLAVNGFSSTVGASLGVIGMYFPTMPDVSQMYGHGFGISGSLNGWGAGITYSGNNAEYEGYVIQGGIGGNIDIWVGGDGSYSNRILSGNI